MLRWIDGFETQASPGHHARRYVVLSGPNPTFNTPGWDGWGTYMECGQEVFETKALVGAVEDTWTIGFAMSQQNFQNASETHGNQIIFRSGSGVNQLILRTMPDPTFPNERFYFEIMRGATSLGTAGPFYVRGTSLAWYYVEFQATIDPTNGAWELRVHRYLPNGMATRTFLDAGPVNTADTGVAGADRVGFDFDLSTVSQGSLRLDDIYICDDTGGVFDDFLGPRIIDGLRGAGNGNQLDWLLAGSAASIEDALNETTQSSGEDEKRITSDVTGDISLMAVSPLPNVTAGVIDALMISLTAKMDSSGDRTIAPRFRKTTGSPSEADVSTFVVNNTTYAAFTEILVDDPNTATTWLLADLNTMQIGVHLVS